jgi:hypothetical protein
MEIQKNPDCAKRQDFKDFPGPTKETRTATRKDLQDFQDFAEREKKK